MLKLASVFLCCSVIMTAYSAHAEEKLFCVYNDYRTGPNIPFFSKYSTISVEEAGTNCKEKFSIKIHERKPIIGISKHGIPSCAFPVKVCVNNKNNCITIREADSYTITEHKGKPVALRNPPEQSVSDKGKFGKRFCNK